ncbi:LLM class flavin-dependent oxidoreductase [Nocardia rhamnosiphila]|uniref:LLM class flavin-dependent oxidoreductase n=1 Tax=Nocardia rhamnosiphila TaxID=426716 RepID=UPI0033CF3A6D
MRCASSPIRIPLPSTAIWTRREAEFHGEHVDFDPLYSWPKPVQRPRPPIWPGGWGPSTHERILDHADGWPAPAGIPFAELERGGSRTAGARRSPRPAARSGDRHSLRSRPRRPRASGGAGHPPDVAGYRPGVASRCGAT